MFSLMPLTRSLFDWVDAPLGAPITSHHLAPRSVVVEETPDAFVAKLAVPGVAPESITIELAGSVLTIDVDARSEFERHDGSYRAAVASRWQRRLQLPDTIDREAISASCDYGVLSVTMPKAQAALPRRIEIAGTATKQLETGPAK